MQVMSITFIRYGSRDGRYESCHDYCIVCYEVCQHCCLVVAKSLRLYCRVLCVLLEDEVPAAGAEIPRVTGRRPSV